MPTDSRGAAVSLFRKQFQGVFAAFAVSGCLCIVALPGASAQVATAGILAGVSTDAQIRRGDASYQRSCASCHGANLIARSDDAPSLKGPDFTLGWPGKSVGDLFDRIRTSMPMGAAASLGDQQYVDIVSFILQSNGYPAGDQELKPDLSVLKQITIVAVQ